jgi:transcriptional regulator with XRE-family HTH domain
MPGAKTATRTVTAGPTGTVTADSPTAAESPAVPGPTATQATPAVQPLADPPEPPGLPQLLRGWRARAGGQLNIGKTLTQADLAARIGMSERWYRDLEAGTLPRLDGRVLSALANTLLLDADERATLYSYALGGTPYAAGPRRAQAAGQAALRELLDRQLPRPAYLADGSWNVLGHNRAMAEWFPWVLRPGANLLRWALTTQEAREQLLDWSGHARMYLAMIRFALAQHPDDAGLRTLFADALRQPDCLELWAGRICVVASRDGHLFRLRLPHVAPEVVEVVAQVLIPARHQSLRMVVLV